MLIAMTLAISAVSVCSADDSLGCSLQTIDKDGTIHTGACSIPFSSFASKAARDTFIKDAMAAQAAEGSAAPPTKEPPLNEYILAIRKAVDGMRKTMAQRMAALFPVTVTSDVIGGVQTDVVVPRDGISPQNKNRVLINLRGGGMMVGGRYEGQVMSIPIASIGKIKVITIDFRMAPEHRFPAASEDVAAVYAKLLKRYPPGNIGIYGCAAGGTLTVQSLAWFQARDLPRPGAVGLLCSGGADFEGDSFYQPTTPPFYRQARFIEAQKLYGSLASSQDPLFNPWASNSVIANFPPTLFINATRDFTMSSATHSHLQLIKANVPAELYIWEGMEHAFMYDPNLPESREAYDVIVKFFERHLARSAMH
jgi:acetyl esterase/lipase